jgi:hypothetical protein
MSLIQEIEAIQNPALGAVLLWKFCLGYSPPKGERQPVPFLLLFLVLPLCLQEEARSAVLKTRKSSGLRLFELNLREGQHDRVLSVQSRVDAWRNLTLRSLAMAHQRGLIQLHAGTASVEWVLDDEKPTSAEAIVSLVVAAERLGAWFSEAPVGEVLSVLRVRI